MRKYDDEFKREAVCTMHDGQSVASVARELGCREAAPPVAARMTAELVIKAFKRAVGAGGVQAQPIVHTGRGAQYVSNSFRALVTFPGCRQSLSRRANCYANAQVERLFSRYKAELLEGGVFEAVRQARSETVRYSEGYYNRMRRHSVLGCKSPDEFERESKKQEESSERVGVGKT